ncbi:putative teichoic acid biosynthesis protein [Legionella steigerwaltii]|uniref:Teichoic acid biosynthesis protein n=1 Tax=Legionella steigerwaltii TaxID=460 RepID=A0A378L770_9GAMM|nr:putative teichoic acid biosynthesis protein [Legionella steigerwaltii]STY22663.1 putative teichoic acid biosynthesis protein [Legionella steigerwaltii]
MRVYSKRNIGFQEVYTDDDVLPLGIDKPEKKPFIILTIPDDSLNTLYLSQEFPLFKKLGYSEVISPSQILTITSKRKVEFVINAILSSADYNHAQNEVLLNRLRLIQQELVRTIKPKNLPPKSKNLANYHPVNVKITRENNAPEPIHSATKVQKHNKSTIEILKIEESGRRITEIEAFNGIGYRLLLNDRTPRVRSVHDAEEHRRGVLSQEIDNFQSLHDYYLKEKQKTGFMRSPMQKDIVKSGIGRILAAAYTEEENDLHGGNIQYDPIKIISRKIDHDQATWPFTSKYRNKNPNKTRYKEDERAYGLKPKDAFPITQRDITNFPHLQDAKPQAFPDETDSGLLDLQGIENDPDFIKDAFSVFLKRALFDEQVYRPIANATIGSLKLREELIAHKIRRSQLLRKELLENEKFLNFIISNPSLKAQILDEFREYNEDYKENSSLRLNLDDLGNKFDAFIGQTFNKIKEREGTAVRLVETYYKPYLDYNSYQYKEAVDDSSQRKQATIEQIKLALHVTDNQAESYFNNAKGMWLSNPINTKWEVISRKAENTLEEILADIIKLDGKLGFFGGEERTLDNGNEIIIPKGAAAIFDLYKKYKNNEIPSAMEALEAMIKQAAISNAYKGHTWFNRRQNETSDVYNNIVAIQHRIFFEDGLNNSLAF